MEFLDRRYYFIQHRSLKVATYVGLTTATLSIIYGFYMVVTTILFGNLVPGFPSLLVAILFLGGLQLIFLGIIGEYLGRTFNEVKRRPLYLVRQWEPSTPATAAGVDTQERSGTVQRAGTLGPLS